MSYFLSHCPSFFSCPFPLFFSLPLLLYFSLQLSLPHTIPTPFRLAFAITLQIPHPPSSFPLVLFPISHLTSHHSHPTSSLIITHIAHYPTPLPTTSPILPHVPTTSPLLHFRLPFLFLFTLVASLPQCA